MKKLLLEKFIKKYTLSGIIESVKWTIDSSSKQLKTLAISDEKNLLVDIRLVNFSDINSTCIGIYNTCQLFEMLRVLGDEINIKINSKNDKVLSLTISDTATEIEFGASDLDIIPNINGLKKLPDFNAEIIFNENLINRFIKAKKALNDINFFTIRMNKKNKLEIVIGNGKINTNKIILDVETRNSKKSVKEPINFDANHLRNILLNNDICNDVILKVSDAGLANISFVENDFQCDYYMTKLKNVD